MKNKVLVLGIITLLIITIFSISYGFLNVQKEGGKQKIVAGVFNIDFKDGETVKLEDTYPMSDSEGMNTEGYTFTIENTGNVDAKYTVKLEDDKTIEYKDRLNEDQIKYSIKVGEEGWSDAKLLSDNSSIIIDNKELKTSSTVECSLKIWVDSKVGNEGQNKSYSSKIVVEAIQGNIETDELESSTSPIIILEGDYVEYIEQGSSYEDKEVKEIKDDKDSLLTEEVTKKIEYYNGNTTEVVDEVNTENIGVYYITYSISDNEGNEGKVVRTVNVYKKDTTSPTIEINGENNITIKQNGEYIEKGAHAEDEGEDITSRVVTEGVVNTKNPGVYIIKYIVTDDEGNTASTTREVTVEANKIVVIRFEAREGIESITEERKSCEITGEDTTCRITLPEVTYKSGYEEGYFVEDESLTEGESPNTEIEVSENKTYYAKAKDIEAPVCKLESTEPTGGEVEPSGTVKIVVNCTDNSGSISNDLTKENISVTYDGSEGTTDTTVDSGTTIENGKKYTITLTNFSNTGLLSTTIKENAVTDKSDNGNIETTLELNVTIISSGINLPINEKEATYNNDTKHNLFEFNHEDGTTDYRYIGNDPYNYVTFNNEEAGWRIIGVFTEENAEGVKKQRIKLMKDQSIGQYAWDNYGQRGSNNWTRPAALNTALNNLYWNSLSGNCPNGSNSATKSCNFSNNGLKNSQSRVENMKWHLGAISKKTIMTTDEFYQMERGNTKAADGGDISWNGNIGLIYPSDFGYTFAKGVNDCYESFGTSGKCTDAKAKDSWIINKSSIMWTMSPSTESNAVFDIFATGNYGVVSHDIAAWNNAQTYSGIGLHPVLYLKSNIGFIKGTGTKADPYIVDVNKPVIKAKTVQPQYFTQDDTIKIEFDCIDDSGKIISTINKDNLEIKINGEETTFSVKELSNPKKIENGIRYTLTLGGFKSSGILTINVKEGLIKDSTDNINDSTILTPGFVNENNIKSKTAKEELFDKANNFDKDYNNSTEEEKHEMYPFEHDATSQLQETTDYRYIGNNPYNYVTFNGEDAGWRIIGVFADENAEGVKEQRIKLMKDQSIGQYAWDNSGQYGNNNWSKPAALNTALNNLYWNNLNGNCPAEANSAVSYCNFLTKGLKNIQEQVENMKWYLGAGIKESIMTTDEFYQMERGNTRAADGGNISWNGNIGLIYPSDFGYTFAKGVNDCYESFGSSGKCTDTKAKDSWIINNSSIMWTMSSSTESNRVFDIFATGNYGVVSTDRATWNDTKTYTGIGIHPVLYLKSDIEFMGGTGTKLDPYIIDSEKPQCFIEDVTSKNDMNNEIEVNISCTDNSEKTLTNLTKDNVDIKINGEVDSQLTKEIIDKTSISKGDKYTLKLSNITKKGALSITLKEKSVYDVSHNGIIETTITPGIITNVSVEDTGVKKILEKSNSLSKTYSDSTENEKKQMYPFYHNETQNTKETIDYRYIGNNPYNYVTFNGEEAGWRIIGVFTDENSTGVKEQRIKLMKDQSIGQYAWDNSGQYGNNNWSKPAALNTTLNNLYWNSLSGNCPNGGNSATKSCDFSNNGLKNSQSQIENMKWYLGAGPKKTIMTTEEFYKMERENTKAADGGNISWNGNIGLIYLSDFGYTFAKGVNDCYESFGTSGKCTDAKAKDSWIINKSSIMWTMSSSTESNRVFNIFATGNYGVVSTDVAAWNNSQTYSGIGLHPVLYLKSNIKITGGDGSKTNPYAIG